MFILNLTNGGLPGILPYFHYYVQIKNRKMCTIVLNRGSLFELPNSTNLLFQ